MPHENIHSPAFGRIQVIWKPAGHVSDTSAEPEEGYVQLLSEDPESTAVFPGEPPYAVNEAYTAGQTPGQPNATPEAQTEGYPPHPCTGFAVMLDRDGINRTIRMLRRARDAAFGSDA